MFRRSILLVPVILTGLWATPVFAQTPPATERRGTFDLGNASAFESRCGSCHTAGGSNDAPSRGVLAQFAPERVLAAITTGPMQEHAEGLANDQRRQLAEFVANRPLGNVAARAASAMPNRCVGGMRMGDPTSGPRWNGPTGDPHNTRFIPADMAQLPANRLSELTLKWAFGMQDGSSMRGQPTVVGGWLFIGSDNGMVYALDARSGCVHWSFEAKGGVNSTVSVAPVDGAAARYAVFFGDFVGYAYAVDAETGTLLWTQRLDEHSFTKLTGAPVVDVTAGRVYFPVGSWEELGGLYGMTYECCTFRGSLAALDAATGRRIWQTYTIEEPARPIRVTAAGTQLYGPAGAGVWVAPTIDHERGAIYVGTSNGYIGVPDGGSSDAIHAFDLESGHRLWKRQLTSGDFNYQAGCGPEEWRQRNCPGLETAPVPAGTTNNDVSASVILHTLPDGRDVLIAAQETRRITVLDPNRAGEIIWQATPADRRTLKDGNLGLAVDASADLLYVPLDFATADGGSAFALGGTSEGGITAIRPGTGERVWSVTIPKLDDCDARGDPPYANDEGSCRGSHRGAVTAIPGAVFTGSDDGFITAHAAEDGRMLWQFDTVREFETVNAVAAKGGAVGGLGPTVVGGMLYVGSGYFIGGTPGNVLLAFGLED